MRWLRYAAVGAAGIVAAATFFVACLFAAFVATQLIDFLTIDPQDDPIFGSGLFVLATWLFWLPPLLGACGFVGFFAARRVHKWIRSDVSGAVHGRPLYP